MHGSEKPDRYIRFLRLLQLRSMMSVDDVTFGGGQGRDIRSDMKKFLRALAVKEGTGVTRAIHPDAVPSFWVDFAKAIGASSWALPIIKTRR